MDGVEAVEEEDLEGDGSVVGGRRVEPKEG